MKQKRARHSKFSEKQESGHGLMELLMCIPLMLLIIFGGIDVVHYLHQMQIAQTFSREGANQARRVCIRHFPDVYLDSFCMNKFLMSTEGTLKASRMLVSLYRLDEDGDVELVDFIGSYEDAEPDDSEINADKLASDFQMVKYAQGLRDEEETEDLVPMDEFFIAVSEIWYEHDYFSTYTFASPTGYQVSVY